MKPPFLAKTILQWLLDPLEFMEFSEDIYEVYSAKLTQGKKLRAKLWYWARVLESLPGFLQDMFYWRIIMVLNYLKIAWRNIQKHKVFTFINICGLTIGIIVCVFILLWVKDELSFDRFNTNIDQLYRVVEHQIYTDGTIFPVAVTPELIGPALKDEYPEVLEFTRFRLLSRLLISSGEKRFYENGVAFADPALLNMFSFPLLEGNPESVLTNMDQILISRDMAAKYFGNEDPIGRTITLNNALNFIISGVFENIPKNSHLRFDYLGHFDVVIKKIGYGGGWWNNNFYTYIELAQNADAGKFGAEIYDYLTKIRAQSSTKFLLQPVRDIHLRSNYAIDLYGASQDRSQYVYIFTIVAFIVLLIACINFMNLATARSGLRGKEVGLRKVVGARRGELVRQFFGESMLFAAVASLLALVTVRLLLPAFNTLTGKSITADFFFSADMLLLLLGITIITGFFSGIYPALFLSAFQPVSVLRGTSFSSARSAFFRKTMVVLQFTLSIVFIAGALIIGDQLRFIQSRNLGFDKEAVLHFRIRGNFRARYNAFKNDLLQLPGIHSVTTSSDMPTYTVHSTSAFEWDGKSPEDNILIHQYSVGYDFTKTFGIQFVAGRDFSQEFSTDRKAFIVNETAVQRMGYDNALGKAIQLWNLKGPIIGVVKDFNFKSLHTEIEPLLLRIDPRADRYVFVKLDTNDLTVNIASVRKTFSRFDPAYPFEFGFLDEELERLYRSDRRVAAIFNLFTGLAIFISCLGLFGLASFLIERRTKEIGIRKVLGANMGRIVLLLSSDFLKWVAAANLIACPVAYYAMSRWLQNFAFRTPLTATSFLLAAVLALGTAVFTISYFSLKAARSNPADSLRYE